MTTQYLLPCTCGEKVLVDNRQSGESVACVCGRTMEVPTLRGLAQLERADAGQVAKPQKRPWGPRQGVIYVGLLLAAAAFAYAGYLYFFGARLDMTKAHENMMKMPPAQTWAWWRYLSEWTPGRPTAEHIEHQIDIIKARRAMNISLGAGVCALLVAASGLLIRPTRR